MTTAQDYIDGAQLAEKMVGVIGERGWCTGYMCVTEKAAHHSQEVLNSEYRAQETINGEWLTKERTKLLQRTVLGAVCLEGAALVALDYSEAPVEQWDAEGHEWLIAQPAWQVMVGNDFDYAFEFNDKQTSAEPVVRFLENEAKHLYRKAEDV